MSFKQCCINYRTSFLRWRFVWLWNLILFVLLWFQIILTIRDEDSWLKSLENQSDEGMTPQMFISRLLSPTMFRLFRFFLQYVGKNFSILETLFIICFMQLTVLWVQSMHLFYTSIMTTDYKRSIKLQYCNQELSTKLLKDLWAVHMSTFLISSCCSFPFDLF